MKADTYKEHHLSPPLTVSTKWQITSLNASQKHVLWLKKADCGSVAYSECGLNIKIY